MTKRVFLYVNGEDYSAMEFDKKYNAEAKQALYENMVRADKTIKTIEEDDIYAVVRIAEFGEIDDEFISFVFDKFVDYDVSKAQDIFEVKPYEQANL